MQVSSAPAGIAAGLLLSLLLMQAQQAPAERPEFEVASLNRCPGRPG